MLRNLDFIFWGVSGFWKEVHEGDRNKSNIVLRNVESGCGVWMGWGSHPTTSGVCGSGQLYVSSPGWVFSSAIYPACELS